MSVSGPVRRGFSQDRQEPENVYTYIHSEYVCVLNLIQTSQGDFCDNPLITLDVIQIYGYLPLKYLKSTTLKVIHHIKGQINEFFMKEVFKNIKRGFVERFDQI